jgi:hypothetical protein
VTFDASASDPNDTVLTFEWDFDCNNPPNPDSVDSTQGPIAITSFPTAGTFDVCLEVTNDDTETQVCSRPQVVLAEPDINDANPFDPNSRQVGQSVQIFGTGFASSANGGTVSFNGTNQPAFTVNAAGTTITTTVPAGATDGPITVTNGCGADVSGEDFDVIESLSINDVTQAEGTGAGTTTFTFTVTLSSISDQATSVDFTTAPGGGSGDAATEGTCGVAGDDYEDSSGTLNIAAGLTSGQIFVTVCRDADIENAENFTVTLSNPVNAVISDNTGVGTITNDD